jgi:hypothetical protein
MKKRSPKQITKAGLTLSAGYIALPFIPFKKAKNYSIKIKKQPSL